VVSVLLAWFLVGTTYVFRLLPHLVYETGLASGWALVCGFLVIVAEHWWSRGLLGLTAVLLVVLAWRFSRERAVADPDGITVYGIFGETFVGWEDVAAIGSRNVRRDFAEVYEPVITRRGGGVVRVTGAASWSAKKADQAAARIDEVRRQLAAEAAARG